MKTINFDNCNFQNNQHKRKTHHYVAESTPRLTTTQIMDNGMIMQEQHKIKEESDDTVKLSDDKYTSLIGKRPAFLAS